MCPTDPTAPATTSSAAMTKNFFVRNISTTRVHRGSSVHGKYMNVIIGASIAK
jgi:hypothetical protein